MDNFSDLLPTYDEAVAGETQMKCPLPTAPRLDLLLSSSLESRKLYSPNHLIPNTNGNVRYDDETPTVFAVDSEFHPAEDALALYSALEEDMDATDVIKLICSRNNEQRVQIMKHYTQLGGTNLKLDEDEFDFRKVLVAVFQPFVSYYCDELHNALNSFAVEDIFQILCILSNDEMKMFIPAFENKFEISLKEKLEFGNLPNISDVIMSLCEAKRDESLLIDDYLLINDMRLLMRHTTDKFHERSEIRDIFVRRSFRYLHELFTRYEERTTRSIEKIIKYKVPDYLEPFYLTVVRYAASRPQFFAKILCKCLNFKMDKTQLNRIIITRCEIDLAAIKKEYQRQYLETLRLSIKGATSGSYKHILYGLIREKRSSEI